MMHPELVHTLLVYDLQKWLAFEGYPEVMKSLQPHHSVPAALQVAAGVVSIGVHDTPRLLTLRLAQHVTVHLSQRRQSDAVLGAAVVV